MKTRLKILAGLLSLCLPVSAGGQGAGTITGQILPAPGDNDLPGIVTVRISGPGVDQVTFVSGAFFSFEGIPDGNYTISVRATGRKETVIELPAWSADRSDVVVIQIGPRAPDETVPPAGDSVVDLKSLRIPKEAHKKLEKGVASLNRAQFGKAQKYFEEAIRISPDFHQAHNNLGVVYLRQNRLDDAEKEFAKAVQIQPENVIALKNLALLHLSRGRAKDAIGGFSEALRLQANDAQAEMYLGGAYAITSDTASAKEHLLKAVRLDPGLPQPHYMLGYILLQENENDEARREFQAFLRLNPSRGKEEVEAVLAKLRR